MSDEFFSIARQEIQSEISSLQEILLVCTNDHQLYEKSSDVERHMHKIKGLAPMMGQEKVGEIARISDIIAKHVMDQGVLKDTQNVIYEAVQMMHDIFNEQADIGIEDFKKHARKTCPQISGF